MTKCKIIGLRNVSFKDEQTNRLIDGVSVYYVYPDSNVTGTACGKCFCNSEKFKNSPVKVNDECYIMYNNRGKVDGFILASKIG